MPSRRQLLGSLGGVAAGGVAGASLAVTEESAEQPTALVAGSLLTVATETPGATVEAHGSATVHNLVVDGLREPDVVALADPVLFDGIADEYTLFATNALVLTYDPTSDHAETIAADWRSACRRAEVRVGRTDPMRDPLGYRTVMALELDDELDPAAVLPRTRTFAETGLSNALEAGGIDAAFTYRNMAVERDLPYVDLPTSIDFSDPAMADEYARASYDIGGRTVRGAPVRYGIAAMTDGGSTWLASLTGARARLRTAGFEVPGSYPRMAGMQSGDRG
ncbi:extracellular solute-binding protein [Haloarchaeobius sp. TZWWS8]|uniref:extracellular solute-binding protein n=1 Tax=Haloarchaeobius sp. TZWWS8 TaxID=3446121 RepID=UPI003EBD35B8